MINMPRNISCHVRKCKRRITTRRLNKGKEICSYHEKRGIGKL